MRIAISNIAWDVAEDEAVAALLARHRVDAIDVAHSKYFPDVVAATEEDVARVRRWWANRGIGITGMQALLYGTTGLNLFGPAQSRRIMINHLRDVCRIGEGLGATRLVFGSPKNRDRTGLAESEAEAISQGFFRELGEIAVGHEVCICLEPNPVRYRCNFLTTTAEAAAFVRTVDHPGIRLHLDTGTIAVNGEDAERVIRENADIIAHAHASEPDLLPLGEGGTDHARMAATLCRHVPDRVLSIETLPPKTGSRLEAIERSLAIATRHYRDGGLESQQ